MCITTGTVYFFPWSQPDSASYFMTFMKVRVPSSGVCEGALFDVLPRAGGGKLSPGQPPELGGRRAGHFSNPTHLIANEKVTVILLVL